MKKTLNSDSSQLSASTEHNEQKKGFVQNQLFSESQSEANQQKQKNLTICNETTTKKNSHDTFKILYFYSIELYYLMITFVMMPHTLDKQQSSIILSIQ